jgi:hypothetical protein
MIGPWKRSLRFGSALLALVALDRSSALAQYYSTLPTPPGTAAPSHGWSPGCASPGMSGITIPPTPGISTPPSTSPGLVMPPGLGTTPSSPDTSAPATAPSTQGSGTDFPSLASGAGGGSSAALAAPGGYLYNPIPLTMLQIRNDVEQDINRFDRARFMFATWRDASIVPHLFLNNGQVKGIFSTPKATGTEILSNQVNMDILSARAEVAFGQNFSIFGDLPFRWVHFGPSLENDATGIPENNNPNGVSDIGFGFKYALIADTNQRYVTMQLTTTAPTGDPGLGLGLGCWTIEPAVLLYQRLTDRTVAQGQLSYWIPISGGPGAGNVLTYGAGLSYDLIQRPNFRFTPVLEAVGWTVIGGTEANPGPGIFASTPNPPVPAGVDTSHDFVSATGDTIVNLKFGARTYFGASDLYIGYGHCVTGSRWYNDIVRVEYRFKF